MCKFHRSDMCGMYFFNFASCEPLNRIFPECLMFSKNPKKDTLAIKVCWNVKTSLTTAYLTKFDLLFRDGLETNRQRFADICKSRQGQISNESCTYW